MLIGLLTAAAIVYSLPLGARNLWNQDEARLALLAEDGMHRFLPTPMRMSAFRVVEVPVGDRARRWKQGACCDIRSIRTRGGAGPLRGRGRGPGSPRPRGGRLP